MALDHYIPQVHLRKFSFSRPPKLLKAFRKSDKQQFNPRTQDVCRIDQGNTNHYLRDVRAIEKFLEQIEPSYNRAVDQLETGSPLAESILTIAGFVAYISSCSPTATRLDIAPLRSNLHEVARRMDEAGQLPVGPDGRRLSEWIESRDVDINIDQKYPQAIGISNVVRLQQTFASFDWELLHNPVAHGAPFVTSDFPVGYEATSDLRLINKIVPLKPDLAIRICPHFRGTPNQPPDVRMFRYRRRTIQPSEANSINMLLIQCAEDLVFFADHDPVLDSLLAAGSCYCLAPKTDTIHIEGGGTMILSTFKVTRKT